MARCGDGSLLTGVAEDAVAAVRSLNEAGRSAFLAYSEEYMNEKDAAKRSESIRRMSGERKEHLLALANMRGAEEFAFRAGSAG
jgi:predicted GIY-YIG superfamily endonuclease